MLMYSDEDKEAFARKDKLIVAQSSIKAAVDFTGEGVHIKQVLDIAEIIYDWVFQKVDGEVPNKVTEQALLEGDQIVARKNSVDSGNNQSDSTDTFLPEPTDSQKKWLKIIEENYGYTIGQIWERFKKYPKDKKEATQMTLELKKGK